MEKGKSAFSCRCEISTSSVIAHPHFVKFPVAIDGIGFWLQIGSPVQRKIVHAAGEPELEQIFLRAMSRIAYLFRFHR
jgi:hypothetical protein